MAQKDIHDGMIGRHQVFLAEYLKDFDGIRAAREAGYKNPSKESQILLDPERHPLIASKIRAEMDRRDKLSRLTSEYVKGFIFDVLEFCPGDYFRPGGKGGWEIDEDSYRKLPKEIKRLIEEVEFRSRADAETGEGETTLWIRFVSKTAAMNVAAKYTLTQKIEANVNVVNWDDLYAREGGTSRDEVEELIESVERRITVAAVGEEPKIVVASAPNKEDAMSSLEKRHPLPTRVLPKTTHRKRQEAEERARRNGTQE